MSTLNDRIAKYRKLANLTQTDMAEKLNIKCSTYSQMERKGIISADRLFEMARFLAFHPVIYLMKPNLVVKRLKHPSFLKPKICLPF